MFVIISKQEKNIRMAFLMYTGAAVLATSVASSVATKAITSAPSALASVLNRGGISDYFTSTAKTSYKDYYKMMVSEGPLFDVVMGILSKNADKAYGIRQDPRVHDASFLNKFSGTAKEAWISADVLCFRNATSFYDYSAFGRSRVRFYYDSRSSPGQAVVMCKKKSELEDFRKRLTNPNFNPSSLVFIGVG